MTGGGFYPGGVAARFASAANACVVDGGDLVADANDDDWTATFWVSQDDISTGNEYWLTLSRPDLSSPWMITPQAHASYSDVTLINNNTNTRFDIPGRANGSQHHIAILWDHILNAFEAYVDGALQSVVGAGPGGGATEANRIGGNGTDGITGYMAHHTLHTRKLTFAEISAMANYDGSSGSGGGVNTGNMSGANMANANMAVAM